MPRSATLPIVLTSAERAALQRAQRAAVRHSYHWRRIDIVLLLDRLGTCEEIARRMRCQVALVRATRERYVEGGRSPASLVMGRAGRPVSRRFEVLPLLRVIRRDAGRELFASEFRDILAKQFGINLGASSVEKYLKTGKIPTRGRWSNRERQS